MPLTCPPSCKDRKTVYYWDAENAPIPYDLKPDDLLEIFRSGLIRYGVFEMKVFVGGFKENHMTSRMSLRDKETFESHGIPLFYAESEEPDAADNELLRVLKTDDIRSKYKNNIVIIGGDHLHVKHLRFCQDKHKRNVMLLYSQALKISVGNVIKKQISLREYMELPPPSKQEKVEFDRAKRIASGNMDSYLDGQIAKKRRKEQRRKARKAARNHYLDDEAEELQALGINELAVLNKGCSKLLKEDGSKKKKNKKAKGFKEEEKHKMKGSCKGKRGRGVVREEKKQRGVVREEKKHEMEEDEEEEMKRKGSCKGKRGRGVVREDKKQRGVVREEKKHKMEEDEEEEMKRKGSCKGKRGRGVVRAEKKPKKST